jgi:hypothetical protein
VTSLEALNGIACTVQGTAGSVSLTYDADKHAVFTCVLPGGGGGGGGGLPSLKVNEVMTGTSDSASNEFVEIFNASDSAVDIGGYKLVYRSATGTSDVSLATVPAGTTLAAHGFYLFGGSGYGGPPTPNQTFSSGLASTAGGVGLREPSGVLVDSVGYGATAANGLVEGSPAPAPPSVERPGKSAARLPDGHDTNDNSVDFVVTTPTPGAANA